ncbi:hypothetical protein MMF93_04400 [Streptomyces tubbatahanensis]|uniref:Uncharacterized protein n=1 Tax=Streptomyces tubbatahanensis TaxID=2923272 RepID=A0ABY3XN05_9ACTN|nr:hypothetical protein [Streptomyces tubbatahanensis]UNS95817.1 hypothetical protein MMF93_04400 [Streptomyces tubbatahanensis]
MSRSEQPDQPESRREERLAGGGDVHIGAMTGGAVATGSHGRAVHRAAPAGSPSEDVTRELVAALAMLNEHLRLLTPTEETAGVRSEIETIRADIDRSGAAPASSLERLRAYLEVGTTAVSGLASALPVVQAIERVLG